MTLMEIPNPSGFLHVDNGGAGDLAVVFVHAFGGNTTHWSAQLEHLRKERGRWLLISGVTVLRNPRPTVTTERSLWQGILTLLSTKSAFRDLFLWAAAMGGSVVNRVCWSAP